MVDLFSTLTIGALTLPNRIVMAPMTRGRAEPNGVPTAEMAQYYALRADAGLVITEGVCVSPRARGWNGAPSIYTEDHIEGWRRVTEAVHKKGGRIFAQLWFLGRVSHPVFLGGEAPWAPSAIRPDHHVHAPSGEKLDCVTPHAMTEDDIHQAVADFALGARSALQAGFDGVQIHGANGYLVDQFLRDGANQRIDHYGGSVSNRIRFLRDVVEACCTAVGHKNVAVRLSPLNQYNDIVDSNPAETFTSAAQALNDYDLAFVEIMEGLPGHFLHVEGPTILPLIRQAYKGVLIANGGYDKTIAEAVIKSGGADAVSFGVPFISNPDLVSRLRNGHALSAPNPETFYSPGEPGYLDYPPYSERTQPEEQYKTLSLDEARKH